MLNLAKAKFAVDCVVDCVHSAFSLQAREHQAKLLKHLSRLINLSRHEHQFLATVLGSSYSVAVVLLMPGTIYKTPECTLHAVVLSDSEGPLYSSCALLLESDVDSVSTAV